MKRSELEQNIHDLFEGQLTGERLQQTQHALKNDLEARELYKTHLHMHNALQLQASANPNSPAISIDSILKRQRHKVFRMSALATAAILLVSLTLFYFKNIETPPPVMGSIKANSISKFEIQHKDSSAETPPNTLMNGATLVVTQGTVSLSLENGVESIIQAPAELTLHDTMQLQLDKGRAWFQIPEQATGFTVSTKDIKVVDLGTEFGVLSCPYSQDEVHVFKGSVEVTSLEDPETVHTIKKDAALKLDEDGDLLAIAAQPNVFQMELTTSLPYYHWSFDSVENEGYTAMANHLPVEQAFAKPSKASAKDMQVEGRWGNAIQFSDRTGEEMPLAYSGPQPEQPFTIACWIKLPEPAKAHHAIAAWSFPDPDNRFGRWALAPQDQGLTVFGSGVQRSSPILKLNQWHHVAYVYTGEANNLQLPKMRIFVDGIEHFFKHLSADNKYHPTGEGQIHPPAPFSIGAGIKTRGGRQPVLNATIDELFYIEGVLTPGQIRTLAEKNSYE